MSNATKSEVGRMDYENPYAELVVEKTLEQWESRWARIVAFQKAMDAARERVIHSPVSTASLGEPD
jgi:hypothetical protein